MADGKSKGDKEIMTELDKKISDAMHRIEDLYHSTNGECYLSFSGGKDSTVILAIIKMCEEIYTIPKNSIPAVFSNTGLELGATIDFVKWCKESGWYENIEIIRPDKSFDWILKNYGKPIKSKMKSEFLSRYHRGMRTENTIRNLFGLNNKVIKIKIADKDMHLLHDDFDIKISEQCCRILKKKPFAKYNKEKKIKGYILGERMAEGGARALNNQKRINEGGKFCTKTKGEYIVKLPIVDWSDKDIEEFIEKYNVPLSKAYTEHGYDRTGCFLCPYSKYIGNNLGKLHQYEPNRYKAAMHWLKDVYIAQNVKLPFDEEYEKDREAKWDKDYTRMRNEMLLKHRPKSRLCPKYEQLSLEVEDEDSNNRC